MGATSSSLDSELEDDDEELDGAALRLSEAALGWTRATFSSSLESELEDEEEDDETSLEASARAGTFSLVPLILAMAEGALGF